jgi:ferredoxin
MSNPCKECIVRAMCQNYCDLFEEYTNSSIGIGHKLHYIADFLELKEVLLSSIEDSERSFIRGVKVFTHGSYNCIFKVHIREGEIYGAHG